MMFHLSEQWRHQLEYDVEKDVEELFWMIKEDRMNYYGIS